VDAIWVRLHIRPVLLWSDTLIYGLAIMVGLWFYNALRREFWRDTLKQVVARRIAMLCFGVLCVYATVGFLDTLHYREVTAENPAGGNIRSALDAVCQPLVDQREKTYSKPFATHSFQMETMERDGKQIRDYPRLRFAGKNLANPEAEWSGDIQSRVVQGLLWTVLCAVVFFACSLGFAAVRNHPGQVEANAARRSRALWIAGFLSVVALLVCEAVSLTHNFGYHIFGTDKAGIDVFYSAIKSIRTGLIIGVLTTLIVAPFAILFGILAGYFGGWVDDLIQYVYTTLGSIPDILLIAAAMLIMQVGLSKEETSVAADKRLIWLCIILGVTSWVDLCRLIRAEVFKLREAEFVQAADAFGVGRVTLMFRHLIPNIMHLVLINMALRFSGLVLAEAVLAYVGIGVDRSTQSWGNMINQARLELARDPVVYWNLSAAFIFMVVLVLAANLFSDAVRDALDPRLRTR